MQNSFVRAPFRKTFSVIALGILASLGGLGCDRTGSRVLQIQSPRSIVGGAALTPGMPLSNSTVFILSITPDGRSYQSCTGTVLTSNIILTAAHCIQVPEPNIPSLRFKIYFGNVNLRQGQFDSKKIFDVTDIRVEPHWKGTSASICDGSVENDLAALKFSGPLPPGYSPAVLLPAESIYADNLPVWVAGFGVPDPDVGYVAKIFKSKLRYDGPSSSGQIAIFSSHIRGVEPGDSGGPAAVLVDGKYQIFGIVSNHCPDGFEYFESLPPHLEWLRANAAAMNGD